jgi:phosphonopyruvate decarboxylase
MIKPSEFFNLLQGEGVEYFAGVPDSLLKAICAYISDSVSANNHVISANEGAAVGLGIGYHLATGNLPLVYMQNSGLGNIINPLTSLADEDVYSIPMLLLIGWRGEPGVKDEPQHVKQGRVTLDTLEALGVPYEVIDSNCEGLELAEKLKKACDFAKNNSRAFALVVRKGAFEPYTLKAASDEVQEYRREDAIKDIVEHLSNDDIVVSTTGMASRELFEYRKAKGQSHGADFLTVGGMGHASQIAMGIASQKSNRNVLCIDGDGAALMHMGSLAIIGQSQLTNYKHIVINNGAHDSVGGQPTVANSISLPDIAKACGYSAIISCDNLDSIGNSLNNFFSSEGPCFMEIKVGKGNRKDLGRPTTTPIENKIAFMQNLKG